MKLISDLFQEQINLSDEYAVEFVLENKSIFNTFVKDIYKQISGDKGLTILSDGESSRSFAKEVEIITQFIPFEINNKKLLNAINKELEQTALNEDYYSKSMELMTNIENYFFELTSMSSVDLDAQGISLSGLIKMASICIRDAYPDDLQKIIDYMLLTREYLGKQVFIFVNMRGFFSDFSMNSFVKTAIDHKFYVMLLETMEQDYLTGARKVIIDNDLCTVIK